MRRFSVWIAALAVVTVGGLLPVVATAPAAHAAANEVLILGSTVSGGTGSLEAQEAACADRLPRSTRRPRPGSRWHAWPGRTEPPKLTRDLPGVVDEGALQDGGLAGG